MSSFLELALRQRVLVIALACLIAVAGIYSFRTIAIDAFPDVTTVLVQVVTEVQGLSPESSVAANGKANPSSTHRLSGDAE